MKGRASKCPICQAPAEPSSARTRPIAQAATPGNRCRSALPVAGTGEDVVVASYPAKDPRNDMKDEVGIFQGFFNVKRLQHGALTGLSNEMAEPVLLHDRSTLGGNSGSAVFDFREDQVTVPTILRSSQPSPFLGPASRESVCKCRRDFFGSG